MATFVWDKNYEIGISSVDEQHSELVRILGKIDQLAVSDHSDFEEIKRIYTRLVDYAAYHFEEEERLMREAKISPAHIQFHKQEHQGFVDEVSDMIRRFSDDQPDDRKINRLFDFLSSWLVYHILGVDKQMAKQISFIEQGQTPEQAFHLTQNENSQVGPLLAALQKLFSEIKLRNKELIDLNRSLEATVAERTEALTQANKALKEIAMNDELTGLPNRRSLMNNIDMQWRSAQQTGNVMSCAIIDLDFFKQINDTYGHSVGDACLKEVARGLRHNFRNDDFVARIGGDEFIVILPNTSATESEKVIHKVRKKLSELVVYHENSAIKPQLSIGIADSRQNTPDTKTLMIHADEALYQAKKNKRGTTAVYSDTPV